MEVGLTCNIQGEILQEAVGKTLQRMPYFADAFVEKKGDFFYAENPLPMEVKETCTTILACKMEQSRL